MFSAFGKDNLMGRALLQHCFNGHRQGIISLEVEKKARRHNTSDKFRLDKIYSLQIKLFFL